MRVIAGDRKGFKLASVKGDKTRPTADRVKEALFSMLAAYIGGARVLDLFAGTGALGIEALSRGASYAVFIDNTSFAAECIKQNLGHTDFTDKSSVIRTDARKFLETAADTFDIIMLDPPYRFCYTDDIFSLISARNLLRENGIVSLERGAARPSPGNAPPCSLQTDTPPYGFVISKTKIYGNTEIILFNTQKGDFNGYYS